MSRNAWEQILERLRTEVPEEDFRRWFGATAYASDSGDQITVWVPTEGIKRTISHFEDAIDRARAAVGRHEAQIRFVVSGLGDEDDEDS